MADLSYIIDDLRPLAVPIDEVEPDPENAMGHGAEGQRGRRPADQPIEAFFGSDRDWPATMFVVVNDGLRQGIRMGRAWGTVEAHGNDLHDVYPDVCRELMSEKAGLAGYDVDRWAGVAKVNHVSRSARSPFPVDLLLVHRS
jgi:hypothetical protein